jgi:inorganic pyrophosphatase
MDISKIPIGEKPPPEINVIVEIPQGGDPVKYEMDKDSGALFVNRFWQTSMVYPANYGFIPHTLSADGDPCDALVLGPRVMPGSVVRCRPIGALLMEDEGGEDEKIITVPVTEAYSLYASVASYKDLPPLLCEQITHFFRHYKDLEKGKWVNVAKWADAEEAVSLINAAIKRELNGR